MKSTTVQKSEIRRCAKASSPSSSASSSSGSSDAANRTSREHRPAGAARRTLGLREVLVAYADRYGVPVMLTETCVTGSVEERAPWLTDSVEEVVGLAATGVPVVGYRWWPVFDMYEWTYRYSVHDREAHRLAMGLWSLEERPGDLARVPTPLVAQFRALAQRHAIPLPTPIS